MSNDLAKSLAELKNEMQQAKDQLKSLNASGAVGVRLDDDGRVASYFEDVDDEPAIEVSRQHLYKSAQPTYGGTYRNRCMKSLRAIGYQPRAQFKNMGDMIRSGMGRGPEPFRKDLLRHFDSIKAVQGMSEGIGSEGGFFVPPEFSLDVFERVYSNDIWSQLDHYTVSGNSMTFLASSETSRANGSRHGGLDSNWIGEGATISSAKPGVRPLELKLKKLAVVVYLTDELLEDTAMALEQRVNRQVAEEFEFRLGDSVFSGNGNAMPLGVHNSPSLVSVAKETGQAADSVVYENIEKMWSRGFAPHRARATWYMNQDVEPQLQFAYLDSGNGMYPQYTPPGGMSAASYGTLKGRPAVVTEFNETVGDQGDIGLYDLSQVVAISKGGIAQASSMHVEFLTDQMALRFTLRVDAQPWENAPITPYKGSNTQSSFVVLDARA